MTNYIKSKIQQVISFLFVTVIAISVFCGELLLNPSPSYAYNQADYAQAMNGIKDLSGADLSRAKLSRAKLSEADLNGADLNGAKLSRADLSEADLSRAKLIGANLSGARLSGADLNGARLIGAIADSNTKFPNGFDAKDAGVIFK
jgi:hypothetical protein